MTDKKQELKPCPFCGGKADKDIYGNWIFCGDCGVGYDCGEDHKGAIKLWNTRPESIPISELEKLSMDTWKAFQFAETASDKLMVASQHFKDLQKLIAKGSKLNYAPR